MEIKEIKKNIETILTDVKNLTNILFESLDNIDNETLKVSILAEYMELLNNYNWKPWSKTKLTHIEEINKKVEIIDIFILSLIYYIKNVPYINIEEIVEEIEFLDNLNKENINYQYELSVIENAVFNFGEIDDPELILKNIIDIMPYKINSLKELFFLIETKIILSTFRDKNGYREKKYNKTWNGLEDNHYIYMHILPNLIEKENDLESFKRSISSEIEKTYNTLLNENKLEHPSRQIIV
jgi:hypothetical protein